MTCVKCSICGFRRNILKVAGGLPFESRHSTCACRDATGCRASHQEVSRCCTSGKSEESIVHNPILLCTRKEIFFGNVGKIVYWCNSMLVVPLLLGRRIRWEGGPSPRKNQTGRTGQEGRSFWPGMCKDVRSPVRRNRHGGVRYTSEC